MQEEQQVPVRSIVVNAQYVKDISFENPRASTALTQQVDPAINLGLEVEVNSVKQDMYEVILRINADAVFQEQKIFLITLEYAGLFTLDSALDKGEKEILLSVQCPNLLFPYARRVLSDITKDGGYPPLLLSPVDFGALYMQRKQNEEESEKGRIIN